MTVKSKNGSIVVRAVKAKVFWNFLIASFMALGLTLVIILGFIRLKSAIYFAFIPIVIFILYRAYLSLRKLFSKHPEFELGLKKLTVYEGKKIKEYAYESMSTCHISGNAFASKSLIIFFNTEMSEDGLMLKNEKLGLNLQYTNYLSSRLKRVLLYRIEKAKLQ